MKIQKFPKINTIIGCNTLMRGDLSFQGGLHLDGQIIGNVISDKDKNGTLTISQTGKVKGNVRVTNLKLDGMIVGDVYASGLVQLASNAKVIGSVYYQLLEMDGGAEVNGQLAHEQKAPPQTTESMPVLEEVKKPAKSGFQSA